MSKTQNLTTEAREALGSANARRLRVAGRVPVNVYGHGEANQNLSIEAHPLELALHSSAHVFNLKIAGKEQPCLVKHVEWDTFGQRALHVDFARISLTEEVEVEVQLIFTGHAKGVGEGGTLAVHHPLLWVSCLASAIPESLEVDVTELEIGRAMHASEIKLPAGVKLDTRKMDPRAQIVGVVAPHIEEVPAEETPAEGAVPAEGAAPAEGAVAGEAGAAGAKPGAPAAAGAKGAAPAAGGKPGAPAAGGKPGAPAAGGKPGAPPAGGKAK